MAGFDDLVAAALPYLATETIYATAGTTWVIPYDLVDDSGNPIDISTGYTATWNLYDEDGVSKISTGLTVAKTSTGAVVTATATASVTLPKGTYFQELVIVRTSDSATVLVVGAQDSRTIVKRKAAA